LDYEASDPYESNREAAMSKDQVRAAVLRFYHESNQKRPGAYEQTAAVAHTTGLEKNVVLEAQQYFVDKGFLSSGPRQQIRGGDGLIAIMARITDSGTDFVEHPSDWSGSAIPTALINIFAQGNAGTLNVAGRDLQVVGGNVNGSVAQGQATAIVAPFPIDKLRELLADQPEAFTAVEEINEETSSTEPRWGKVVAALETLNHVVVAGEATQHVLQWAQHAAIPEYVQQAAKAIFGA
jgi:hypothetical protein